MKAVFNVQVCRKAQISEFQLLTKILVLCIQSLTKNINKEIQNCRDKFEEKDHIDLNIELDPVYDCEDIPVFVENICQPERPPQEQKKTNCFHVFILMHGLGGSYHDMLPILNEISLVTPNAEFIYIKDLERSETYSCIQEVADKVSDEILYKLNDEFEPQTISKISFIAHSLGGIVARAALPNLIEYKNKFHSFCTLGSPHLGVLNAKFHIQIGTVVAQFWFKAHCLKQLRLADAENIEDTFLYELSETEGLEFFKYVCFFSSTQDYFVPYYSSR